MIAKPEDTPISNPLAGQDIPKFEGGALGTAAMSPDKSLHRLQVKELGGRHVQPEQVSKITSAALRDAVLTEYEGKSDEHVLGGKVTAKEAMELFQKYYEEHPELKLTCSGVSAAEIYGAGGKRTVWLPDTTTMGQELKGLRITSRKQQGEIEGHLNTISHQTRQIYDLEDRISFLTRVRWWQFWRQWWFMRMVPWRLKWWLWD